jgi:hypothetical protein
MRLKWSQKKEDVLRPEPVWLGLFDGVVSPGTTKICKWLGSNAHKVNRLLGVLIRAHSSAQTRCSCSAILFSFSTVQRTKLPVSDCSYPASHFSILTNPELPRSNSAGSCQNFRTGARLPQSAADFTADWLQPCQWEDIKGKATVLSVDVWLQ